MEDYKNIFYIESKDMDEQLTIAKSVTIKGKAGFTGQQARVTLEPADPNTGIIFQVGRVLIPATVEFLDQRNEFSNTTILRKKRAQVVMVEHLLAALVGLGITNVRIKTLKNGQIPILDGSSFDFCNALIDAGIVRQEAPVQKIVFYEPLEVRLDDRWAKVFPTLDGSLQIDATIEYRGCPIGIQQFTYKHSPHSFCLNLAWARTFAFNSFKAIEKTFQKFPGFYLKKNSFIDSNMIIYNRKKYLVDLRRPDECVRHKVLDFIGDIALLGAKVQGFIKLYKPGHRLTHALIKKIWEVHNAKKLFQYRLLDKTPETTRMYLQKTSARHQRAN